MPAPPGRRPADRRLTLGRAPDRAPPAPTIHPDGLAATPEGRAWLAANPAPLVDAAVRRIAALRKEIAR